MLFPSLRGDSEGTLPDGPIGRRRRLGRFRDTHCVEDGLTNQDNEY
jgi:hypothetical protein